MYTIRKNDFSVFQVSEIADILTDAFLNNPVIGGYFFDYNRKKVAVFMQVCTEYYARFGSVYTCVNSENRLVAVSLWTEPGSRPIGLWNVLKGGMLFSFLKVLSQVGLKSLYHILQYQRLADLHHPQEPHCYLFMLASIEKGAGRTLLQHNMEEYKGETLYWESSVGKDNHAYYKSFGAEMFHEERWNGTSTGFFMRKKESRE